MATTLLPAASTARTFPAPGVAAGIERAVATAWATCLRLDGAARRDDDGRIVDRTFVARRLHVVRRDSLHRAARAVEPSVPA
jgi:hypothetical protein